MRHVHRNLMTSVCLLVGLLSAPGIAWGQARPPTMPQGRQAPNQILYVAGSSKKICQITGEIDREINKPTVNQTETRWGLKSADGTH